MTDRSRIIVRSFKLRVVLKLEQQAVEFVRGKAVVVQRGNELLRLLRRFELEVAHQRELHVRHAGLGQQTPDLPHCVAVFIRAYRVRVLNWAISGRAISGDQLAIA